MMFIADKKNKSELPINEGSAAKGIDNKAFTDLEGGALECPPIRAKKELICSDKGAACQGASFFVSEEIAEAAAFDKKNRPLKVAAIRYKKDLTKNKAVTDEKKADSLTESSVQASASPATELATAELEKEDTEYIKRPNNSFKKFEAWFGKFGPYIIAPIFIFGLFMAVLYALKVYPFGTANMSNYDLLAQIVPFYEHFFDVIDGKSTLFYSPSIVGGADVFGTLAYCAVSPFTFVFLLFGKGQLYNAASIVLPLKMSVIAIVAIYFLKKKFKNLDNLQVFVLAMLYTYCGYTFVSNTYINWMDFLIYMPFVVLGFEKLVKQKKILPFAIAYALMIYTCFSIACFALILVFIIMVLYALIVTPRKERISTISRMCLSLVVAVAIALPILVPSFIATMKSARASGLFENIDNDLDATHLYRKATYIVSDALCLFLTVVYFIKNGLKKSFNLFLFLTGAVIMMPVLVDEVCYLLNAGSYFSYALRFGFLNAFYMLYVGARLLNETKEKVANKYTNIILSFVFMACSALVMVFIYRINESLMIEGAINKFSGNFAHSTGGLEVIAKIAGVIMGLLTLGLILYATKLLSFKTICSAVSVVLLAQVCFYNIHLVKGNYFTPERYDELSAIADVINEKYEENDYYRIKDYNDTITADAPLTTHTNSFGVFSSVIDKDNFAATQFFGYKANPSNLILSADGMFLGDSLLGYKYAFYHYYRAGARYGLNDNDSAPDGKSYIKNDHRNYFVRLDDTEQQYFVAYENTLVFPSAFTTKSGDLAFDSDSRADNLNKLLTFLGGDEYKLTESSLALSNVSYLGDGVFKVVVPASPSTGHVLLRLNLPEGVKATYNYGGNYDSSAAIEAEKCINFGYALRANYYTVSIKLENMPPLWEDLEELMMQDCLKNCLISLDTVAQLKTQLDERAASFTLGAGSITANATATDDETYLFLNYVALDGFDVKVNGHDAEFIENGLNLMLLKLDNGENTVEMKYTSPYIKYMAIGLIMAVIILFAVWLFYKKHNKVYSSMQKVIGISGIVLACGLIAFFIIYPTGVCLVKLVKLLIGLF